MSEMAKTGISLSASGLTEWFVPLKQPKILSVVVLDRVAFLRLAGLLEEGDISSS